MDKQKRTKADAVPNLAEEVSITAPESEQRNPCQQAETRGDFCEATVAFKGVNETLERWKENPKFKVKATCTATEPVASRCCTVLINSSSLEGD